ncbi:MAG: tetratricopeptide repeat protein [Saprospiraceae bacterium]|nr:tetratricopeptide repeat protein [Saprospiraceae bacterium]
MIRCILICLAFLGCFQAKAQHPFSGQQKESSYETAKYLDGLSLYGLSSYHFTQYLRQQNVIADGHFEKLFNEALFSRDIAELFLELPHSPTRLHYDIDKQLPDPITIPAILELGGYYYNQRAYKQCVETYDKTDLSLIPTADQVEPRFRKGYCLFVMKEFENAKAEFNLIKKDPGLYYFHIQYYLGLCEYFTQNPDKAVTYFQAAEQTPAYKPYIPYYICQIYFKQQKFNELITYGEQSLQNKNLKNQSEIRLLIGQAYFLKNDYQSAMPHMSYYASTTEKMSVEEFYVVGYTYYKNENYSQAISYFDAINLENNQFGQLSNYYLADCYLRTNDPASARIAFKNVSQMSYIPLMQEEAAFNYAKLTAETGIEREAIQALENIKEASPFYESSRDILADVLERSGDLNFVFSVFERQKNLNVKMKIIYQSKLVEAGHKSYLEKNWKSAVNYYDRSLRYPESREKEAEALYWLAYSYQQENDYDQSVRFFNQYFTKSKKLTLALPYSPFMAYYGQGYNYIKQNKYKEAGEHFEQVHMLYFSDKLTSSPWKQIASDAMVRHADCLFKEKNYAAAKKLYQNVINQKWEDADYALFQKALILGLQNEPYEKIVTLKELANQYKTSDLLDDTYLQLGDTYGHLSSLDNAYQNYQELIKKFNKTSPFVNEARIKSALIAYNKGDLNTAIKLYKEVLPNNATPQEIQSAVTGLEEIYINDLGKPDEYLAVLEKLPGYKPSDYSSDSLHYKVGEVRFLNGEYEKAIDAFSAYIQKFPLGFYATQASYYRGESYAVLKKYTEALKDYEKVIAAQNSSFFESSLKKAALITYNHTMNYTLSYTYYDQYFNAGSVISEKIWAASGAMRSAFKNNDFNNVVKHGQFLTDQSLVENEEKTVAFFFMGKSAYLNKNYEQALSFFRKIGKESKTNQAAEARFWMGDILIKSEKWAEAEAHCNESNELNTYYPYWIARTVLLLADIYMHNNDLYSARAAVEAVLENFADDEGLVKLAGDKLKILEEREKTGNKIKEKSKEQLILDNRTQN